MPKLLAQTVVGLLMWHGMGWCGGGWLLQTIAVLIGVVLVHRVWERFVFQPYDYLGVLPVADDDPIMLDALATARATLPAFIRAFPGHPRDSMVKFRVTTPSGRGELVWADLLEITGDTAKAYVRTPPAESTPDFRPDMTVAVADILDWQIEASDGTLRGGYTNRALFRIFERTEGYMHPKFLVHLRRFRELDESVPAAGA
jgi:uncharacterized protein YegJ (DUF2314 family)